MSESEKERDERIRKQRAREGGAYKDRNLSRGGPRAKTPTDQPSPTTPPRKDKSR